MRVEGDEVDDMRRSKGRKEFIERNMKWLSSGVPNCVRECGQNWVFLVRQWGRVPRRHNRGEEEGRGRYGFS